MFLLAPEIFIRSIWKN